MRTENERDRDNTVRAAIGRGHWRGRRKPTAEQLDAWYLGQPEAIDVCCRRLLADILRGGPIRE